MRREVIESLVTRAERLTRKPAPAPVLHFEFVDPDDYGTESWVERQLHHAEGRGPDQSGNAWAVAEWRRLYPDFPNGRPNDSGKLYEWKWSLTH